MYRGEQLSTYDRIKLPKLRLDTAEICTSAYLCKKIHNDHWFSYQKSNLLLFRSLWRIYHLCQAFCWSTCSSYFLATQITKFTFHFTRTLDQAISKTDRCRTLPWVTQATSLITEGPILKWFGRITAEWMATAWCVFGAAICDRANNCRSFIFAHFATAWS